MPSDASLKAMNAVHRALQFLTRGRVGWRAMGMPVLELTTIGRRSGAPRSVMLTSPAQEGEAMVVVASRGGDDRPPAWLLNLTANPAVQVRLAGHAPAAWTARIATEAERARLWPRIVADHRNYGEYQRKTTRTIALVLLTPGVPGTPQGR